MLKELKAALKLLEDYEVRIDREWGDCKSLAAMEEQGDLPQEIVDLRRIIADMETKDET